MEELDNKRVTVFFDDKSMGIGRKDAVCIRLTSMSISLRNSNGDIEVIPLNRVIRIVAKGESQ